MKILLVEDEIRLSRLLVRGLAEAGNQVDACSRGEDAFTQAQAINYDVVILDWSLPDGDGVAVLRRWRERGVTTPVLMLTARGTVGERIVGLRAGADDYLPKPFDFQELLARLEAVHRRSGGHQAVHELGSCRVDATKRVVMRGEIERSLTAREFALLLELAGHTGEVLTRSELLTSVWGSAFDGSPNVVDVYVGYLRTKFEELNADDIVIHAVRGVGFRLAVRPPRSP